MQNVNDIYIKKSYTFQRILDTKYRVITKVYDFLGQPSYIHIYYRFSAFQFVCGVLLLPPTPTPAPTQVIFLAFAVMLYLSLIIVFIHYVFTKQYALYFFCTLTHIQLPLKHNKYIMIGRRAI